MPEGVNKDAVEKVLWDTLTADQLSRARANQEPLFTYEIQGRKNDRTGMFKVKDTLAGLFKLSGTTVIANVILCEACKF